MSGETDRERRRGHNVLRFLERAAARVPDRTALGFGGGAAPERRVTFAELRRRAARLGSGLRRQGLQPGDRAIVMVPMSPDLYAVLLGILGTGAVAVFVDPWIGRRQIAAFSAFAEPRAWIGVGRSHLLRWLDSRLRTLPMTVTTGRRVAGLPAAKTLAELESAGDGEGELAEVAPADPALVTFTSGSSGVPKGVNRTHGFLAAQHRALAAEFEVREDDVDLPMFPIFALNNLGLGIPSVVPEMDFRRVDKVDAGRILDQMGRFGVTTATASPPFFDRLADTVRRSPSRRPALRRILTGGAPVSDAQLRSWRDALPETEIQVVYGSTEAEPVAHVGAAERLAAVSDLHPRAPGFCVGRPSRRVKTRLAAIATGPLSPEPAGPGSDGIGELLVTGDHVAKDYYRNPEAVRENKVTAPDGEVWHRMGDTGYFDGEGRFWLVGRVHSTILGGGGPVHPQLLEQAAAGGDDRVRRVAAVGLPGGAGGGERAMVVVEGEDDGTLAADVEGRLAAAGLAADEIRVTARALPLDPRHRSKIDYARLRSRLVAGERR